MSELISLLVQFVIREVLLFNEDRYSIGSALHLSFKVCMDTAILLLNDSAFMRHESLMKRNVGRCLPQKSLITKIIICHLVDCSLYKSGIWIVWKRMIGAPLLFSEANQVTVF